MGTSYLCFLGVQFSQSDTKTRIEFFEPKCVDDYSTIHLYRQFLHMPLDSLTYGVVSFHILTVVVILIQWAMDTNIFSVFGVLIV